MWEILEYNIVGCEFVKSVELNNSDDNTEINIDEIDNEINDLYSEIDELYNNLKEIGLDKDSHKMEYVGNYKPEPIIHIGNFFDVIEQTFYYVDSKVKVTKDKPDCVNVCSENGNGKAVKIETEYEILTAVEFQKKYDKELKNQVSASWYCSCVAEGEME